MSQFKFADEMKSLLNIDGPLTKGPVPRYQLKKVSENLSNKSSFSINSSKTPTKLGDGDVVRSKKASPGRNKSPGRTPTPNKGAKTPNGGDRFIPSRSATNFEMAHFKLYQPEESELSSPSKEMQRALIESLHGCDINKQRILSYQNKAPTAPAGFQNPNRILYTQIATPASIKSSGRYVSQTPDRILDAPDIIDDYYLNLLDWSGNNILAVALGSTVYLWDAGTGKIEQLLELEGNDYVCSLSWIQEGDFLAVGTSMGPVELWDCSRMKKLRTLDGQVARVSSLSWNSYILSTGCRSGRIIHHDVRQRDHNVSSLIGHTQEVCGLKWSTDGKYLASGGNDNVLNIWPVVTGSHYSQQQPLYSLTSHQAAVKALAWCPWQPHILASGGGTADRHIRFWNCHNGGCINSVDTKSQVCSVLWSDVYKELASGHGFANNQLTIWKYPGMSKVAELTGHTARVLHLALSPDGSTILSAGADETLRLWKCFVKDPTKSKDVAKAKIKNSILTRNIR